MESIGAFDAKTHLSALLVRVEQGESIVITKHGKPVARLVPENPTAKSLSVEECIQGLFNLKKGRHATAEEIKSFINEGRKY